MNFQHFYVKEGGVYVRRFIGSRSEAAPLCVQWDHEGVEWFSWCCDLGHIVKERPR